MPPRDDLDAHFREHPRLKKYAEMFDAQRSHGVAHQQRMAWLVLLLAAIAACYVMAVGNKSWNPLDWGIFGSRSGAVTPAPR